MDIKPNLTQGGQHTDHRGTIQFFNEFDMSQIKRFYIIQNKDIETVRAWRAHKIEQRWLFVSEGEFLVRLVQIDNWEMPGKYLPIIEFTLSSGNNQVLHIPQGYGSWLQANEDNSKIFVFADFDISHASQDDYLYPEDYFDEQVNI